MHPSIKRLEQCLAYATFSNDDVEEVFDDLFKAIGDDLDEQYEQGEEVQEAMDKVDDTLNNISAAPEPEDEDDEDAEVG